MSGRHRQMLLRSEARIRGRRPVSVLALARMASRENPRDANLELMRRRLIGVRAELGYNVDYEFASEAELVADLARQ